MGSKRGHHGILESVVRTTVDVEYRDPETLPKPGKKRVPAKWNTVTVPGPTERTYAKDKGSPTYSHDNWKCYTDKYAWLVEKKVGELYLSKAKRADALGRIPEIVAKAIERMPSDTYYGTPFPEGEDDNGNPLGYPPRNIPEAIDHELDQYLAVPGHDRGQTLLQYTT